MRLSLKFSLLLLGLLAVTLGVSAWQMAEQQRRSTHDRARQRAELVMSFGQAARAYAHTTASPAVDRHTKAMVLEAQSDTFVARGMFEELGKLQQDHAFREASLNPLNERNRADA